MSAGLRVEVFSADLDATADFYVRVLGFELRRDERSAPVGYLALEREGVHVGAAARPAVPDPAARRPPTGVELVLEVDDLDAERARVAAAGWPVDEDVVLRPWGLRDFRLLDPDGYYLRITTGSAGDAGAGAAQRGERGVAAGRDPDLSAALAGIGVGALAVLGATAVALRWLARRPAVRTVTLGPRGWLAVRSVRPAPRRTRA